MSDGRDQARWNDPPCYWCNEKRFCRKPPRLLDCSRLDAWKRANPDEKLWPEIVRADEGRPILAIRGDGPEAA